MFTPQIHFGGWDGWWWQTGRHTDLFSHTAPRSQSSSWSSADSGCHTCIQEAPPPPAPSTAPCRSQRRCSTQGRLERGEGKVSKNKPIWSPNHGSPSLFQHEEWPWAGKTAHCHPVTLSVINWLVLSVYKSSISGRERSADMSSPQGEHKQDLHRTIDQTSPKHPVNIHQLRFDNICSRCMSR